MANYRAGRVKQEIQREVNDILSKRIKDPRVQNVTITDVDLTGDLQNATIYYSTLQELASERENVQLGLEKATGLIRKELGSRLTLYRTPELVFKRDESIDYGNKIEELIRQIHDEDETK
ncbi:MAG TPA: 30S ribosome-binding factor RbfA [Candidatus Jeotgalibaca pullicola]|nr:30S ribosome-binding factor RbfA [Candidatus Jeotgalibaca pullicola]